MLILERLKEDWVIITTARGERIEIMVTDVRRKRGRPAVKLGIKAPPEVTVHREEVEQRIRQEN